MSLHRNRQKWSFQNESINLRSKNFQLFQNISKIFSKKTQKTPTIWAKTTSCIEVTRQIRKKVDWIICEDENFQNLKNRVHRKPQKWSFQK